MEDWENLDQNVISEWNLSPTQAFRARLRAVISAKGGQVDCWPFVCAVQKNPLCSLEILKYVGKTGCSVASTVRSG